jgi:hypothetical protein
VEFRYCILAHEVYASTVLLTGYRTRCRMAGKYAEPSIAKYAKFACLYRRSRHLVELMLPAPGPSSRPDRSGLTATMSHRGAPDRDDVTSLRLRGTAPGDR